MITKMPNPPRLRRIVAALLLATISLPFARADWPQWRGPARNGIAVDAANLLDEIAEGSEIERLWQSEEVPSDHYGGHGSLSVADGRVYLSVVWHRDEPTDQRTIDNNVLSNLGHRSTGFDDELMKKFEDARLNLNPRLRGSTLEEWAQQWVDENLNEEQNIKVGSWVVGRFKQGKGALAMSVFDTLKTVANKPFAGQAELEAWVAEQNFEPAVAKRILDAVPNTKKVADDSVICLDADSGKTLWKFSKPGHPSGRGSSSTPAIVDGRVYAALSTVLYALDAKSGVLIWPSELSG
jgi:outer membrane protein assembly factor BamB